jgi:hypothetical protein
MRHKIRGKIWNVRRVPNLGNARGSCDPPTKPNKEIKILSSLRGQEFLEVLLHEILHAALWDLDEEAVSETAEDAARAIWREWNEKIN